jgi:hypothetical protein
MNARESVKFATSLRAREAVEDEFFEPGACKIFVSLFRPDSRKCNYSLDFRSSASRIKEWGYPARERYFTGRNSISLQSV